MNFKENLLFLMEKKKLTNVQLSNLLEVNRATICHYLNGKRMPTYEMLEKLRDFFNCSYDDLLK